MLIIEATSNRAMVRTAGQSHVLTRVFGVRRHRYDTDAMTATCRDHEAILQAIQSHQPDAAAIAAAAQIRDGLEKSLQALELDVADVTGVDRNG